MNKKNESLTDQKKWNETWAIESLNLDTVSIEFTDPADLVILGILSSYLDFTNQPTVLELGGAHSENLLKFNFLGAVTSSIDFSHIGLCHTREIFNHHKRIVALIQANIFNLPFNSETVFDFVYSNGLCEHFLGELRSEVFKVHYDLTRKGGISLIQVPNIISPTYQIWYTICRSLNTLSRLRGRLGINVVAERAFSRKELRYCATNAGFKVIDIISSSVIYDTYFWIWVSIKKFFARLFKSPNNFDVPKRYYTKTPLDSYLGARYHCILIK